MKSQVTSITGNKQSITAVATAIFHQARLERSKPYVQSFAVYAICKKDVKLCISSVTVEDGEYTFYVPEESSLAIIEQANGFMFYGNSLPAFVVEEFSHTSPLHDDPEDGYRLSFQNFVSIDPTVGDNLKKLMEIWEDEGA